MSVKEDKRAGAGLSEKVIVIIDLFVSEVRANFYDTPQDEFAVEMACERP